MRNVGLVTTATAWTKGVFRNAALLCISLLATHTWMHPPTTPARPADAAGGRADTPEALPALLSQTGLFMRGTLDVTSEHLAYSPQYPLWTDGARKHRWVRVPRGATIDASDPDVFGFPVGTTFFKEFRFERRVETRVMRRDATGWSYGTYVWNDEQTDAALANGTRRIRVPVGPDRVHDVPSIDDCRTCHEGKSSPVLGFGALQLSPSRDPLAPHGEPTTDGVDLAGLVKLGVLVNLPEASLREAPAIAAASERERAVRGYLFANCSSCHNSSGRLAGLGLDFDVSVTSPGRNSLRDSAVGKPSRFQPEQGRTTDRITPRDAEASVVWLRLASRDPSVQMPPLGTYQVDTDAVTLVRDFIHHDL